MGSADRPQNDEFSSTQNLRRPCTKINQTGDKSRGAVLNAEISSIMILDLLLRLVVYV